MYAPPATPADKEAIGVADPAIFMTANFAEVVDVPPSKRSKVVLFVVIAPVPAACQKLVPTENPQFASFL